jgi:hypothetical protein
MQIWKFNLAVAELQAIAMPRGARILSLQTQQGVPQLWALVNEDLRTELRTFAMFGTGWRVPDGFNCDRFLGTCQLDNGLVFHFFEKISAA